MIHPSWHEPRKYCGAKYRRYHKEHPEVIVFYSLAFFVGLNALGYFAGKGSPSNPNPPSLVAVIVVTALVSAFIGGFMHIAFLCGASDVTIHLSRERVRYGSPMGMFMHPFATMSGADLKWEQVAYAMFGTEELFGREYPVLSLYKPDGSLAVTFGLNPDVAQPKVEAALRAYSVELRSNELRSGA